MKAHRGMRPQDVLILLKIMAKGSQPWYSKELAMELFMSASEVTESLNRSMIVGLLDPSRKKVMVNAFVDFLIFGLRYVYPAQPGPVVKGVPTSHSAPVLSGFFKAEDKYVWPDAEGIERGQAIEPLYPTVTKAVKVDAILYDLLALTDVFRVGKTREIKVARELLQKLVYGYQKEIKSHEG
ncbi:hypothetical protein OCK74_08675 [Chitinophagaceae bacterium LB-8]|uniref:Uncharacterized protein n=1 Tax=Paraflavisolibacter caeni TaxID=2982496 RepID=A0A9X3BH95_9BACT|nr:hypothetical protein [Paraflavisolibacter caeni]MCU7549187.1 hypothetical protein [Paraflavisolibacter caeni]